MIITLIGLGLLVIGIILAIVDAKVYFQNWKAESTIDYAKFVTMFLGSMITFITFVFILINACTYEVEYQNTLHTRDVLEYRIEHMEENITGNEMLYNDIVEFNNKLRGAKKWALNPWTNWFNNQDIASIDYIELDNK